MLLSRRIQLELAGLGQQGVFIDAIYATSRTQQGITFATKIGFDVINELSTNKRKVFEIDMMTSTSRWAQRYRTSIPSETISR